MRVRLRMGQRTPRGEFWDIRKVFHVSPALGLMRTMLDN
jgi:hypothetical protein